MRKFLFLFLLFLLCSYSCEFEDSKDDSSLTDDNPLLPEDVLSPDPQSSDPFLSDTDLIKVEYEPDAEQSGKDILYYSKGYILYHPESDVQYIMIGVFTDPIKISSGNQISFLNLIAGHRTGKTGFSRTRMDIKNLLAFNKSQKDFSNTLYKRNDKIPCRIALWGYNKNGTLCFASPEIIVIIDWTK